MLFVDSCRSRRELPEYTKITPCCSEKSATFMGSKIKKFIFSDFGYFKGITGAIRNGKKRSCVYHDRGSQFLSLYMQ
jgi:hypothetical protein